VLHLPEPLFTRYPPSSKSRIATRKLAIEIGGLYRSTSLIIYKDHQATSWLRVIQSDLYNSWSTGKLARDFMLHFPSKFLSEYRQKSQIFSDADWWTQIHLVDCWSSHTSKAMCSEITWVHTVVRTSHWFLQQLGARGKLNTRSKALSLISHLINILELFQLVACDVRSSVELVAP